MSSKKIYNKQSQKQKLATLTRGIMIAAGASVVGIFVYLTTFFNAVSIDQTKAEMHARMMMGYDIPDGSVISTFNWDDKNSVNAVVGPDAISISQSALTSPDGVNETKGLSAGKDKKAINLEIPADDEFNTEGIDISFDFRRMEETCNFYSRGSYFNFGMKKGKIIISYRVSLEDGKKEQVAEVTKYEIPQDDQFRNYRFVYDPQNGKGEILVNGVTVWNHLGSEQSPLSWNSADIILVGKGMKGNGDDKSVLDNFIVKSTTHVDKMPIHLLNFEALTKDDHIMIRWFTIKETDVDSFRVERSVNGTDFEPIGSVKATGNSTNLHAYALADISPVENTTAYYRLVPSNKPLKSITVPVIGYKYRKDHIENMSAEKVESMVKEQQEKNANESK